MLGQSKFLYGMHETCPRDILPFGWILFLAEIGHGSEPHPGVNYSEWAAQGYGILCRIQHQFGVGGGCIPVAAHLDGFVGRVRTLVENSNGCSTWILGNEPNHAQEWPNGAKLEPQYVASVYDRCRKVIHALAGHEDDIVVLPPIGPWNVQSGYGWIEYFRIMIECCDTLDAFALHTYSRGSDPSSITSEAKMDPPYGDFYSGFRTYRDWMNAIPEKYRDRPCYITEANQYGVWLDENTGWVQAAYKEINDWNHTSDTQKIYCLCLYRWPKYDEWHIHGKTNLYPDIRNAVQQRFECPRPKAGKPPIEDLVDSLPKHVTKRYNTRNHDNITRVIVHHSATGTDVTAEQMARYHVDDRHWPGIGYHFVVGVDGVVEQTNRLCTISYHAVGSNSDSVGVCFVGDFSESVPPEAQLESGAHLIAWLLRDLGIKCMQGHKAVSTTRCPGDQWSAGQRWRDLLQARIQRL